MLCCCARPPGRDERDQAAGGLGGVRVSLVDLHRHADVAADRCVGWVSVSEDSDAVHEDLPPKGWPCRAYSYRVGRRRHGMATATCRGNGERDSTRSRSSIGSRSPGQVVNAAGEELPTAWWNGVESLPDLPAEGGGDAAAGRIPGSVHGGLPRSAAGSG